MDITEEDLITDYEEAEQLYARRRRLAVDFEENMDEINEIDRELEKLGVETVPAKNLMDKIGIEMASVNQNIPSTSTVRWDSQRIIHVYNGQQIELQIIRGVPISTSSELLKSDNFKVVYPSPLKASLNVASVAVKTGLGLLPGSGIVFTLAFSLYDMYKRAVDAMKATSTIVSATIGHSISMSSEMMLVYAKYYGSPDEGYQKLVYQGNAADILIGGTDSGAVSVDGVMYAHIEYLDIIDSSTKSDHYDDDISFFSDIFWRHRTLGTPINNDYLISVFDFRYKTYDGKEKTRTIGIPCIAFT